LLELEYVDDEPAVFENGREYLVVGWKKGKQKRHCQSL
jgi:hypothetical protein